MQNDLFGYTAEEEKMLQKAAAIPNWEALEALFPSDSAGTTLSVGQNSAGTGPRSACKAPPVDALQALTSLTGRAAACFHPWLMAYPGNPELTAEAQERVMTAFRQVVNKLQDGQRGQ